MEMTIDNLCKSCINFGCEFQSGIVRTECAFYMPPYIEPDNCGNYVVQVPTAKNDLGVDAISRADVDAVIEQMRVKLKDGRMYILAEVAQDIIRELPSVTPQEPILDTIRAEIERQEKWLMIAGYNCYNVDIAFNAIKSEVAKYKAETGVEDGNDD